MLAAMLVQLCDFQHWNWYLSMVLHCTYLGICVSGLSVNAGRSVASSSMSVSSHWVPLSTSRKCLRLVCSNWILSSLAATHLFYFEGCYIGMADERNGMWTLWTVGKECGLQRRNFQEWSKWNVKASLGWEYEEQARQWQLFFELEWTYWAWREYISIYN